MIIDLFASPNVASFDLKSLRYLSGGGAAMPQAVAERLKREFGITFAEGYGLTETAAPTHSNLPERAKLQCLGIPIFGVDSRIVDPDTLRPMPIGEVGEIVSHGPMIFKGYWGHPEATRAAFVEIDGKPFFRTGDLGRMDEEGYFFITDRLKRMINCSGFKVWPAEVEAMLYDHPAIQEACVIGARDQYRGETVKAVVVLRKNFDTTEKEIVDWAREKMAAFKVPRVIEFVDALPKTATGKILWRELQEKENRKCGTWPFCWRSRRRPVSRRSRSRSRGRAPRRRARRSVPATSPSSTRARRLTAWFPRPRLPPRAWRRTSPRSRAR
jgi:fatty-acyl-CoA synthase